MKAIEERKKLKTEIDPFGHSHWIPEESPYLFKTKEDFEEAAAEWARSHGWKEPE